MKYIMQTQKINCISSIVYRAIRRRENQKTQKTTSRILSGTSRRNLGEICKQNRRRKREIQCKKACMVLGKPRICKSIPRKIHQRKQRASKRMQEQTHGKISQNKSRHQRAKQISNFGFAGIRMQMVRLRLVARTGDRPHLQRWSCRQETTLFQHRDVKLLFEKSTNCKTKITNSMRWLQQSKGEISYTTQRQERKNNHKENGGKRIW